MFLSCERAPNLHTYANVIFPLISSKIGINKKKLCQSKKKIFQLFTFLGKDGTKNFSFMNIIFLQKKFLLSCYNAKLTS